MREQAAPCAGLPRMQHKEPRKAPSTSRLRSAIDSGATHDKVAFPDPAAAPLGTDAEAGGVAPTQAETEQAMAAEAATPHPAATGPKARTLPLVLGVLALIAVSSFLTLLIFAR